MSVSLLLFGLGILTQLLLTIGYKVTQADLFNLLKTIGITAVIVLWMNLSELLSNGLPSDYTDIQITALYIFPLVAAFIFIKKILPQINELTLVVWNMVFIYVCVYLFGTETYIFVLLSLPTIPTLYIAFADVKVNHVAKLLLYIWFMIMGIAIAVLVNAMPLSFTEIQSKSDLLTVYLLGMTFFYLASYFYYLIYFIPLPRRGQSFEVRLQNIVDHANTVSSKYDDKQYKPLTVFIVTGTLSIILFLNYIYKFIDPLLLISIILAFPVFINGFLTPKK